MSITLLEPPSITDFEFLKPISRGAFGKVFLGFKKQAPDKLYAIKVMKKRDMVNKNLVNQVLAERDALAQSSSPFIVQLYYSLQSQLNIFLIMEYLVGGDVKSLLAIYGYFDEDMSRMYAGEVVLALQYLHSHGIIHRDIKPDNMLITCKGHLKLTDFGLSKLHIDVGKINQDVTRTPLPYSQRMENFRTPGQILSLKSNLGFNLPSTYKSKLKLPTADTPASKKYRSPLKDINSPIQRHGSKVMSLRDRVVSQATMSRLTPPVKSLTPTLQDSLTWGNSGSEGSSLPKESTRLSSLCSQDMSRPSLKLSTLVDEKFSSKNGLSSIATSFESTDSVFDSSISLNWSAQEKSIDSVFNGCQGNADCQEKCCRSHLKVPSRQESIMDDTPQMHRSDESVWNSYAARNLRSMRHGSYSEDSDDECQNKCDRTNRSDKPPLSGNLSLNSCNTSSFQTADKDGGVIPGSDKLIMLEVNKERSYSYHSDEDSDNQNQAYLVKSKNGKRKFSIMNRESRSTGLTEEVHLLGLYGDEHRMKRNAPDLYHRKSDCFDTGLKHYGSDIHPVREFVCLTGEKTNTTEIDSDISSEMENGCDNMMSSDENMKDEEEDDKNDDVYGDDDNEFYAEKLDDRNEDVIITSADKGKKQSNGDLSKEESPLGISGIDHMNSSDLSAPPSPEDYSENDEKFQKSPVSKVTRFQSFLSSIPNDRLRHSSSLSSMPLPHTPEPANRSKHTHFQMPCTPTSLKPVLDHTPLVPKPTGLPVTPAAYKTPGPSAKTPGPSAKTPFKTPRSVWRGKPPTDEEHRILGTPDYLAPEILLQQSHGIAVDWWALGVCLFEFLTGVPPFNDQTPDLVFQNILSRDIPWPGEDEEPLSISAQVAIEQLLTMDPNQRPHGKVVQQMKFFKDIDWQNVLDVEPSFIPQPDDDTDTSYFDAKNNLQQLLVSDIDF